MQKVDEQYELVTALVSASLAELSSRGFDLSRMDCSANHIADVPAGSWRRIARSIEDAELAEFAYFLVCRRVNIDHHVARVYLDDLAEWLVLPPLVYRSIRNTTQNLNKRQIAA